MDYSTTFDLKFIDVISTIFDMYSTPYTNGFGSMIQDLKMKCAVLKLRRLRQGTTSSKMGQLFDMSFFLTLQEHRFDYLSGDG